MNWKHPSHPYIISDNKELLQLDTIHRLLQTSYWAAERIRETIALSIENSICFGIYYESVQVGFARVITDYATFSWICDVMIDPDHRGNGLGKWLMQTIVNYPSISHIRMVLGTRDAHGLYEQYGFFRREMMLRNPQ